MTEPEAAALVAVPLPAGSLGRVPVGALTDRHGARVTFPLVSGLTIVPVLLLAPAKHSYAEMPAVSCLLGGGLGGFVPPLVLGAVHRGKGSYALGFMLLADLALAGGAYALVRMRTAGAATAGKA
ncbi:hypothetical protein [Streptomyces decoyicus]|uniref:hypothetical protein n=1 Tax=Streptomyces decoyicus TaxID=249567 RepID=UPI00386A7480|nr:hypothetical protein OG532_05695 [Streptomyces decoyicus]